MRAARALKAPITQEGAWRARMGSANGVHGLHGKERVVRAVPAAPVSRMRWIEIAKHLPPLSPLP